MKFSKMQPLFHKYQALWGIFWYSTGSITPDIAEKLDRIARHCVTHCLRNFSCMQIGMSGQLSAVFKAHALYMAGHNATGKDFSLLQKVKPCA